MKSLFLLLVISISTVYGRLNPLEGRSVAEGFQKVRAVNLGGWLLIEKWMKPSLFDDNIKEKSDLLDGTQIQLKSAKLGKYVSAEDGGGSKLVVNRQNASGWETFKLWRVSSRTFQLRVFNNQFVSAQNGGGGSVVANRDEPSSWESFEIERNTDGSRLYLKATNGQYLQAKDENELTADYDGQPGWDDNAAVFILTIVNTLGGDYQLANALGPNKAAQIFKEHRDSFITQEDFAYLASKQINAVRIPVGWWLAYDPNLPSPFVSGSLQALDNAFTWGESNNIKIIVDLHAAPGSQNPWEHSATRDGIVQWTQPDNIAKTLDVIDFLAKRYKDHPALMGIELLNEPRAEDVPLDTLTKYYKNGYDTVRKYNKSTYVLICQRIGGDPSELVNIMRPSDGYSNVVLDIHLYNLYSSTFDGKSAQWNIDYINNERKDAIQSLNNAGGASIFVGEWTNEWNVKQASKEEYARFGDAQLRVYGEASFGWSYWSLTNINDRWDFRKSLNNGYLRQDSNGGWP